MHYRGSCAINHTFPKLLANDTISTDVSVYQLCLTLADGLNCSDTQESGGARKLYAMPGDVANVFC